MQTDCNGSIPLGYWQPELTLLLLCITKHSQQVVQLRQPPSPSAAFLGAGIFPTTGRLPGRRKREREDEIRKNTYSISSLTSAEPCYRTPVCPCALAWPEEVHCLCSWGHTWGHVALRCTPGHLNAAEREHIGTDADDRPTTAPHLRSARIRATRRGRGLIVSVVLLIVRPGKFWEGVVRARSGLLPRLHIRKDGLKIL